MRAIGCWCCAALQLLLLVVTGSVVGAPARTVRLVTHSGCVGLANTLLSRAASQRRSCWPSLPGLLLVRGACAQHVDRLPPSLLCVRTHVPYGGPSLIHPRAVAFPAGTLLLSLLVYRRYRQYARYAAGLRCRRPSGYPPLPSTSQPHTFPICSHSRSLTRTL